MEPGLVAVLVGVVTAITTWAARSRTISNDEWRAFIDTLRADRDQWRERAIACEQREH